MAAHAQLIAEMNAAALASCSTLFCLPPAVLHRHTMPPRPPRLRTIPRPSTHAYQADLAALVFWECLHTEDDASTPTHSAEFR